MVDEAALHYGLSLGLVASMALSFVALAMGVVAPYGRYSEVRSLGVSWGAPVPARVAWFVQEAPAFAIALACLAFADPAALASKTNQWLFMAFVAHYFNRAVVYPMRIRGGKPTPLAVMLFAFVFCTWNGYLQGRYFTRLRVYDEAHVHSPGFLVGAALFLAGWAINYHADETLRTLRRPGETGYKIPHGGFFEYVSGANFFGEIVEWCGFAVASGFAYPTVAFAVSVVFNLGPRAMQHHRWYNEKFAEDYPQLNRKALIPYLL